MKSNSAWDDMHRFEPPGGDVPTCPVCGEECDTVYKNRDGEVVGCPECLISLDAWLWAEDEKW